MNRPSLSAPSSAEDEEKLLRKKKRLPLDCFGRFDGFRKYLGIPVYSIQLRDTVRDIR